MLRRLEQICVDVATAAIIILGLLIFADVMALNLFNRAVPDTIILVRELMVIAIVMPLAAGTANRAHISVEVFTNRLPARLVSYFVVLGSLIGLLALAPILFAGAREFLHHWNTETVFYGDLNLAQWPGRLAFVLGIALGWIRLLTLVIGDVWMIASGGIVDASRVDAEG
ncbi:TRAP transporter small permease [Roseibium sp. RKSG952]|uniref:TRAP transporter small permease n=1 Tax=Roseibium sp. RKSG952 TaxID=2529384 RepID=UPI0012BCE8F9|nr:TRAP transporter small permease subunit [Roseibium sp. RKSG952]MTH95976.1 TRAP transporter small permease [Roseibium sp. RKSG952]